MRDPSAMTDDRGEFLLTKPRQAVDRVEVKGLPSRRAREPVVLLGINGSTLALSPDEAEAVADALMRAAAQARVG